MLTQRPFPNVSELQVRIDGVGATPRHRNAVDVAVGASTRLVNEQGPCRDGIYQHRYLLPDLGGPLLGEGLGLRGVHEVQEAHERPEKRLEPDPEPAVHAVVEPDDQPRERVTQRQKST